MPQPRYLQIVQQLRDRIQNGEYPPNTRIPTENELSVSMGVSRPTVRQALNLLEQEGRLTRVKGSGTYVTEPKIQHESTRFLIGYQEESGNGTTTCTPACWHCKKKNRASLPPKHWVLPRGNA